MVGFNCSGFSVWFRRFRRLVSVARLRNQTSPLWKAYFDFFFGKAFDQWRVDNRFGLTSSSSHPRAKIAPEVSKTQCASAKPKAHQQHIRRGFASTGLCSAHSLRPEWLSTRR